MRKVLIKSNPKGGRPRKSVDFADRIDRTALTKDNLINTLIQAKNQEAKYFAVQLKLPGCEKLETIINPICNIDCKLGYYEDAYDDNLYLKANKDIQIITFTYGDTWGEVKQECI